MQISSKLNDFNFVLLGGDDGKKPFELGWQKKVHRINDFELVKHLAAGKNYGVRCGPTSPIIINGKSYSLLVVDFDNAQTQEELLKKLPETFTVKTGGKGLFHLYFASDNDKSFKIFDEKMNTLLDVQGEGKQVVGPGSINPKTNKCYEVAKDVPIAFIPYAELEAIIKPYDRSPKKAIKEIKQYKPRNMGDDVIGRIMGFISMKDALSELGVDTSKNPTGCPFHSSNGGKCLGWNDETAHCFHCDKSWNKFSLIREGKNLADKATFEWFAEKAGMMDELQKSRKNYAEKLLEKTPEVECELNRIITNFFSKRDLAQQVLKIQPFYYDEAKNWWVWDKAVFGWKITDEVDIVNMINSLASVNTIEAKEKNEILEALRQEARLNKPKPIQPTWIQFMDEIFDINNGNKFKAVPDYFVTNPIPYKLHNGNFEVTATMDRIFEEWVGKDYVKTLYEIIAYCLLPSYPIHRLFCFVGGGMNGKSKFLELLRKFLGASNCCSTELDTLLNSRFEITRLHKKLICQMGETNFNELNKTSIIKKLTGDDLIGFEYKNKNPFDDKNYAKIIIATNNLPVTTDKTIGFYRRWMIIDFPNVFSEQKDILAEIPEEEYECLALKCTGILKDLLIKRTFHNEGSIEDRKEKYESKSNFLDKFFKENVIMDDPNDYITAADFYKKFSAWCKENRHREMSETSVGAGLKKLGVEQERRYFNWMFDGKGGIMRVWVGIKWRN